MKTACALACSLPSLLLSAWGWVAFLRRLRAKIILFTGRLPADSRNAHSHQRCWTCECGGDARGNQHQGKESAHSMKSYLRAGGESLIALVGWALMLMERWSLAKESTHPFSVKFVWGRIKSRRSSDLLTFLSLATITPHAIVNINFSKWQVDFYWKWIDIRRIIFWQAISDKIMKGCFPSHGIDYILNLLMLHFYIKAVIECKFYIII